MGPPAVAADNAGRVENPADASAYLFDLYSTYLNG
jgi:hypothetical protein